MQIRDQGWECPKCERIWAPKIAACGWCNHGARMTMPKVTIRETMPEWNFTADDLSYV